MIERITEEEEKASEAIANLAGRNGINFRPLSPSSADIRTLEHEGMFLKMKRTQSFSETGTIFVVFTRFSPYFDILDGRLLICVGVNLEFIYET